LEELRDTLYFAPIPEEIYNGDVIQLQCQVSFLYFSNGTRFGLEFENETELRLINGEQK